MSEKVILAFIGGLPAILVAVTGLIVVLKKFNKVVAATDGMKDALVESTRVAAEAKAKIEAADKAVLVAKQAEQDVLAAKEQGASQERASKPA